MLCAKNESASWRCEINIKKALLNYVWWQMALPIVNLVFRQLCNEILQKGRLIVSMQGLKLLIGLPRKTYFTIAKNC